MEAPMGLKRKMDEDGVERGGKKVKRKRRKGKVLGSS